MPGSPEQLKNRNTVIVEGIMQFAMCFFGVSVGLLAIGAQFAIKERLCSREVWNNLASLIVFLLVVSTIPVVASKMGLIDNGLFVYLLTGLACGSTYGSYKLYSETIASKPLLLIAYIVPVFLVGIGGAVLASL